MNRSKAKASGQNGSLKSGVSNKSRISYMTECSKASTVVVTPNLISPLGAAPINEEANEDAVSFPDLEALPEDFIACRRCGTKLTEDEKIINARFVNEAMAAGRDISMFPLRLECFM